MTAQTIATGWLLVGAFFLVAGIAILGWSRSLLAENRNLRRQNAELNRHPATRRTHLLAAISSPENADCMDALVEELLSTSQVPAQRGAVE